MLTALLLSDGKPGHYHQAEGVVAAIAKVRPIETVRIETRRRALAPTRSLHQAINAGLSPAALLWLGYGLTAGDIPAADVVVSGGGETLAANAAAAQMLGAPNIFCGRLRRLQTRFVRLTVASSSEHAGDPSYLVCLPPSPFEVSATRAARQAGRTFGPGHLPRLLGLLIGGNSGALQYAAEDWRGLTRFMREAHAQCGVRWLASTSRRSGPFIGDALATMAAEPNGPLARFIDFRTDRPGLLGEIFAEADAILCTDDSTTMISEAVGAQLPVVAVYPPASRMETRELHYRDYLASEGWYRRLALSGLQVDTFLAALGAITPRATSPLAELAEALQHRLPELFQKP